VLGAVRIGNGCRIGAMSVVLCDVPDGATAVGVPARIVGQTDVSGLQKNIQENVSRIMRSGPER